MLHGTILTPGDTLNRTFLGLLLVTMHLKSSKMSPESKRSWYGDRTVLFLSLWQTLASVLISTHIDDLAVAVNLFSTVGGPSASALSEALRFIVSLAFRPSSVSQVIFLSLIVVPFI